MALRRAANRCEHAIDAAVEYLISRQGDDGLWRDFATLAGMSSDWVSGVVTYALACAAVAPEARLAAVKRVTFRQRPNGGWSYNTRVPTDCDSTAWALLALSTAPRWKPSAIARALRYVRAHQDPATGGFATYHEHDRIDQFIGAADMSLMRGWFGAHVSVTAAAVQSMLLHGASPADDTVTAAVRYLLAARRPDNLWHCYWWQGYAYPTYQAMRALGMARALDACARRDITQALLREQRTDGGWNDYGGAESEAFATAYATMALLLAPNEMTLAAASRGVDWLIERQQADGSWATVPILRIPPPMVADPSKVPSWGRNTLGTGVVIEDQHGLFTTSAALWAIARFDVMDLPR